MSGADTSQVMTGLSKALSNETANGKPMKEALKEFENPIPNGSYWYRKRILDKI